MFGWLGSSGSKAKNSALVNAYTSKGGRERNEDSYGYWQYQGRGVCVLADGLGGHGNGEIASKKAVRTIVETVREDFSRPLDQLILLADQAIREDQRQNIEHRGMRTTVVIIRFDMNTGNMEYGYAGDSRLYLFKKGKFSWHTKDHSMSQLAVDMGQISEDRIRSHEDRNKVTKVLGDENPVVLNASCFGTGKLAKGDAFLLCSDGVWEYVYDTEMEIELSDAKDPNEWMKGVERRLLPRAKERHDNYTMVTGMIV